MTILAVNQTDFQIIFYFFEASIFITKFLEDDNHIYQKFQRISYNIAYLGFKFRKVK